MVGIYKITCGGRWYFGQSTRLNRRVNDHLCKLQKGTHCNPILQNVYNKHQDYKFEVILECKTDELDFYEQMILDVWHGEPECMNIAKCAASPARGLIQSESARLKNSLANKWGNNANARAIQVIEGDKTIMFSSISECAHTYGVGHSTLWSWLSGANRQPMDRPTTKFNHLKDIRFEYTGGI